MHPRIGAYAVVAKDHMAVQSVHVLWQYWGPCVELLTFFRERITMLQTPKRGSRQCVVCGESNGNRAFKCKSCGATIQEKRRKVKSTSEEVTSLFQRRDSVRVFSCKVRKEGPDYRTFVTETEGKWECYYKNCIAAQNVRSRSSETLISGSCEHINDVKLLCSDGDTRTSQSQQHLPLSREVLSQLAIPQRYSDQMSECFRVTPCLVQRVSETSFAVRDSNEHQQCPLGLFHIRILKTTSIRGEADSVHKPQHQQIFHCPCSAFMKYTAGGAAVTSRLSRRCIHVYFCIWALASNPHIAAEFPFDFQTLKREKQLVASQVLAATLTSSTSGAAISSDEQLVSVDSQQACLPTSSQTAIPHGADHKTVVKNTVKAHMLQMGKIPEHSQDMQHVLQEIDHHNSSHMLGIQENSWPTEFKPNATHCELCSSQLTALCGVPGMHGKSYLLSRFCFIEVSAYIKRCTNQSCSCRYCYSTWKEGIFNISNKLFVTLDILLEMRCHISKGEPPSNSAASAVESALRTSVMTMSDEEKKYITSKLYDGYFSFEASTKRDWNEGICGICGVAPVFESGDGNSKNCTPLKKGQFRWESDNQTEEFDGVVDVDGWWSANEEKIIEASLFSRVIPTIVEAPKIAPWIPPACRAPKVLNTEFLKGDSPLPITHQPIGCPKKLADLIRDGKYDPENVTIEELKDICTEVNIKIPKNASKPQMLKAVEKLHSYILQGNSECHVFEAAPTCTGGKVFQNCHHQVIYATKFIVRKESTRDHVDLLLSMKHWPVVYAVDMACDVVAHVEVRLPKLATELWKRRRGCFERPSTLPPKVTNVPELTHPHSLPTPSTSHLIDHNYCLQQVTHPLTQTRDRFIVGDRFHDGVQHSGHKKPTCKYHNMRLCPELTKFQSVTSEVINSKIKAVRLQSSSQQNPIHYYFYNRLMDHWHNLQIVQSQRAQLAKATQAGETIVRDSLQRYVYVCNLCYTPGHTQVRCPLVHMEHP